MNGMWWWMLLKIDVITAYKAWESEEVRQTKFFCEDDKDEKKKNVFTAVVGMEYFL